MRERLFQQFIDTRPELLSEKFSFTEKRIQQVGPEFLSRRETAAHELQHALPVIAFGGNVTEISTKPKGNVLGYTSWSGNLSSTQIQIVAMGGAVDTVFGAAHGYGSDFFKAEVINRFYNGISPEAAKDIAANYAHRYASAVFERAAEILAFYGVRNGNNEVNACFAQAEEELKIERKIKEGYRFSIPQRRDEHVGPLQDGTIFSLRTKNNRVLVKDIQKDMWYTAEFCDICKTENGHKTECPLNAQDKEKMTHTVRKSLLSRRGYATMLEPTSGLPVR